MIKWKKIFKIRRFLDTTPRKSNIVDAEEYLRHGDKIHLYLDGSKGPDTEMFHNAGYNNYALREELGCFFHRLGYKFFNWNNRINSVYYCQDAMQQHSSYDRNIHYKSIGFRITLLEWFEYVGLPEPLFKLQMSLFHNPIRLVIVTAITTSLMTIGLMKLFGF